jgi:hypothetical protein
VITLALKHPFLLQGILSLSGFHLAFLHESDPTLCQKYREAAISYHGKSIAQFRDEIQNISRENSDACSICAALLPLQTLATRDHGGQNMFFSTEDVGARGSGVSIAWYKLQRGAGEVLKSNFQWAREGLLGDMIEHWESMKLCGPLPLEPEEEQNLDALANSWSLSDMLNEDKAVLEETLQTLRLVFSMVSTASRRMNMRIGKFRAIIAWTVLMPHRFCEMVEKRFPQALVLIAIYCILLKRVDEFWWMRGKAEGLFEAVQKELPDRSWNKWLEWPAEQVHRR